jgi:YggT family protein
MGRPWWYDSYWEKEGRVPRQSRRPPRKIWWWIFLSVLSLFLAAAGTGFQPDFLDWLGGFVAYFCRILALIIFIRVLLSWFRVSPYSWLVVILHDLSEPVIQPFRRVIPSFGGFDFSPLVAMLALYLIPVIFNWFTSFFV